MTTEGLEAWLDLGYSLQRLRVNSNKQFGHPVLLVLPPSPAGAQSGHSFWRSGRPTCSRGLRLVGVKSTTT